MLTLHALDRAMLRCLFLDWISIFMSRRSVGDMHCLAQVLQQFSSVPPKMGSVFQFGTKDNWTVQFWFRVMYIIHYWKHVSLFRFQANSPSELYLVICIINLSKLIVFCVPKLHVRRTMWKLPRLLGLSKRCHNYWMHLQAVPVC